jgi:hypothetical protein
MGIMHASYCVYKYSSKKGTFRRLESHAWLLVWCARLLQAVHLGRHHRQNFFFRALFFSYLRSSMISLVFTKVGHRFIRQMRLRHIVSGGRDYTPFEAANARRLTTRTRRIRLPVSRRASACRSRRIRLEAWTTTAASRNRCVPPARQRTPPLGFVSLSLCSSLFSLLSFSYNLSFCYLISSILIAFLDQNQWNLSMRIRELVIFISL